MSHLTRRTMLHAGASLAGAVAAIGLLSPRGLASSRLAASPVPLAPPICNAAAEVPVTVAAGPRRSLRLTWNASAICTVGVPVAQARGFSHQLSGGMAQRAALARALVNDPSLLHRRAGSWPGRASCGPAPGAPARASPSVAASALHSA
jgi:hypothetical protein